MWKIVEKKNPYAVHGLFDTKDRAEWHLSANIPEYVRRGYFIDNTLKPEDFVIVKGEE